MAINYSTELLYRDERDRGHILTELLQIKESYRIENCRVIELGCGLGQNMQLFQADNETHGVEGLTAAVLEARSRGLNVSQGNLELPLTVATDSANWVLCLDVLEHLVNSFGLLVEIRRILCSEGKAIINVPNHFTLGGRLKILLGHNLDVHGFFPSSNDWDNPHLRFFTHRGLLGMVEAAGLTIVEDRSKRFCSFPKQVMFNKLGMGNAVRHFARLSPGSFAAGFFLIVRKSASPAPDSAASTTSSN
jgi:SAM-dependent methyltransferase